MRCLIVDDYADLADLWRLELEDMGLEVETANSAEAAFGRMLLGGFDLVIADLGLPDGSGITVAQSAAIRAPDAEVIMVTAQADFPHGELFEMSSNIAAVFRKATDMRDMFLFVEHLLSRKRRNAGMARYDAAHAAQ